MSLMVAPEPRVGTRPRVGFAGVGWIGRNRLAAIARDAGADICGIFDTSADAARQAQAHAPHAVLASRFEDLLDQGVDGIVIATPSGLHATQAAAALRAGCSVFCQKPLARSAAEALLVIDTARTRNRLLGVDFSYRAVAGVREIIELVRSGELGDIYAADLTFHNAYGPDKPWFYDLQQSGGGCVMDLGIHLLDLLLLVLDYPQVRTVSSWLRATGKQLAKPLRELEDHAFVQLDLETGVTARMACSWNLPAGCEAVIEAAFYGTHGSANLRNIRGSFYDFVAQHCTGTTARILAEGDNGWGGRTACNWVRRLSGSSAFDPEAGRFQDVHALVDRIYGRL
jgi:predicted dehydrogenase